MQNSDGMTPENTGSRHSGQAEVAMSGATSAGPPAALAWALPVLPPVLLEPPVAVAPPVALAPPVPVLPPVPVEPPVDPPVPPSSPPVPPPRERSLDMQL